MAFTLPNIYTYKNLKYLIAIPIVLMLISIYLSRGIVLDSSLGGGTSIIAQTNTTLSAPQLASLISSRLNTPSPDVIKSAGSVSITLAANTSLTKAEDYLISFYAFDANYTAALVNQTSLSAAYSSNPSNATLGVLLKQANLELNSSTVGMASSLSGELAYLKPFIRTQAYNSSNPGQMVGVAQNSYSNATAAFKQSQISELQGIFPFTTYSYQQITLIESGYFINNIKTIIIVAFILISIVVFFIFRSIAPSAAVVFGAANDMIVALGAMAVFKIPLGIASIGGLLMLLGYSIDTDVLTAIRILKRHEGTPEDRAYSAMKTGLTMTVTAIVSFGVLFIVSIYEYVPTYYEISGVVLFGLLGDILTTWFGNASMILLYMKRRRKI